MTVALTQAAIMQKIGLTFMTIKTINKTTGTKHSTLIWKISDVTFKRSLIASLLTVEASPPTLSPSIINAMTEMMNTGNVVFNIAFVCLYKVVPEMAAAKFVD